MLSCTLVGVMKIDAAQKNEHGGLIARHSPGHIRNLHDAPYKLQGLTNASRGSRDKEVIVDTTDPFELAEMSDEHFGKGEYNKAARLFISAAIHGNSENKAALAEIDPTSSKYLNSQHPQSPEAGQYYDNDLTPKIVEYFKIQADELKKHKNMPVKLL